MAASTIAKVLKAKGIDPALRRVSTTWRKFLRRQPAGIEASDFFSVDTVSRRRLYDIAPQDLRDAGKCFDDGLVIEREPLFGGAVQAAA